MPINITVPFERLADEIEQEVDRKYRAFWLVLFNNVNILSPILTGRYRSSHCMSIGQPSASITGTGFVSPPSGLPTMSIANNLPYAERIENGWSSQSPTGVYQNALNSALASFS
nr:hypothetical protein 4 [Moraxellaceae bacterium]BDD47639.1 hypothetical protein 6 [Moraxellaceae bacterium]